MRSISLLTILALLYCPLACVVGSAHGMSAQLGCELPPASPVCCCCPKSSTTTSSPTKPADSDDPGSSDKDCQGICNGAVHERDDFRIDLPELTLVFFHAAAPSARVESATDLRKHDKQLADEHILSGRQIRTRLLALTC